MVITLERTIESAISRGGMITRPGSQTITVDGSAAPVDLLVAWGMIQLDTHLRARGSSLEEWKRGN